MIVNNKSIQKFHKILDNFYIPTNSTHLSMFSFFKSRKKIENPIVATWVKWFTFPVQRNSAIITDDNNLVSILAKIPDRKFSKKELNIPDGVKEEMHFAKLFNLYQPFEKDDPYTELVRYISDTNRAPDYFPALSPFLYQYLIRYMFQITTIMNKAVKNDESVINILDQFLVLLEIFIQVPSAFDDIIPLLEPILIIINDLYTPNSLPISPPFLCTFLLNFFTVLVQITTTDQSDSEVRTPIYLIYIRCYKFWLSLYGRPEFDKNALLLCVQIQMAFCHLNPIYAVAHDTDIIDQILREGFNFISFITNLDICSNTPDDVFELGFTFLEFVKYVIDLKPSFAKKVWGHQMFYLTANFIYWSVNRFPLIEFETTKDFDQDELLLINEYFRKLRYPTKFEFLTEKTFQKKIESDVVTSTIRDSNQILQYITKDVHGYISKRPQLLRILKIYQSFSYHPSASTFFMRFAKASLTEANFTISPKHIRLDHLCSVSSTNFFIIQIFLSSSLNIIAEALEKISGYKMLVKNFVFDTKYNMWSSKPESLDLDFFYLVRFYIYALYAKVFSNLPDSANLVLDAVCELFDNASPMIVDETIKFLTILFRSNPEWFFSILSKSTLLNSLIEYQYDLQALHLFINDDSSEINSIKRKDKNMKNSSKDAAQPTNIQKETEILNENINNENINNESTNNENISNENINNGNNENMSIKDTRNNSCIYKSQSDFNIWNQQIGQSRIRALQLLDLFASCDANPSYVYDNQDFIQLIVNLLFEPKMQEYGLHFIRMGLMLHNSVNIFKELMPLLKEARKHKNDLQWIHLIKRILEVFYICLRDIGKNFPFLLENILNFNFMEETSLLSSLSDDLETRIDLVNKIMNNYIFITKGNSELQKRVSLKPAQNIYESIAGLQFGDETIEIILNLIFEKPILLKNTKEIKNAEIQNQKLLVFLHDSIKHLPQHSHVFKFIARVCYHSLTNKLKVFQSDMPICILKYIRSFQNSKEKKESIDAFLDLFSYVSSFMVKWKTFFESIQSMRPIQSKYRAWWTQNLVQTYTDILSSANHQFPSSFFQFDGNKSRLELPEIPCSLFSNGFTLMFRFELGSNLGTSYKNILVSLPTKSGQKFVLFFEKHVLKLEYRKNDKSESSFYSTKYVFKPNTWYYVIVIVSKYAVSFFVNGKKIKSINIRIPPIEGSIVNGVVANSSDLSSPLVTNMNSLYMLRIPLNQDLVEPISKLPLDFVYSFSPSNSRLFPNLPTQLFTSLINEHLLFCYNARMTFNKTCANLAPAKSIINATVYAHVNSFSTSFRDIATNIGGLKTFLPLFLQVDMIRSDGSQNVGNSDSIEFLKQLLNLFTQFCLSSDQIQTDFIKNDGMKCLAGFFYEIHSDSFTNDTIDYLCRLYSSLSCHEYHIVMLRDIFFNFTLWNHLHDDVFIYLISKILDSSIFSPDILTEVITVRTVLMDVVQIKRSKVRSQLWKFLNVLAKLQFSEECQEVFFAAAFSHDNEAKIQEEVLNAMFSLMQEKVANFHQIIQKHNYYNEFIGLLLSTSERIRLNAVKFIAMLETPNTNIAINDYFLRAIDIFNPNGGTIEMWNQLVTYFFNGSSKLQIALLPLISYISFYYETSTLREFIHNFEKRLIEPNSSMCVNLMLCKYWYLWLLNLMIQANRPVFEFDSDEQMIGIFAYLCMTGIKMRVETPLSDFLAFVQCYTYEKMWDLTNLVRKILLRLILLIYSTLDYQILGRKPTDFADDQIISVISEIIPFIYFLPSLDPYYENVQLYFSNNIFFENSLTNKIENDIALRSIFLKFDKLKTHGAKTHFSMRVNPETGKWDDCDIAIKLAHLISLIKPENYLIEVCGIKVCEVFGFLIGCVLQTDPSSFDSVLVNNFLSTRNHSDISTVFHLIAFNFYRSATKYPSMIEKFQSFMLNNSSFLPKSVKVDFSVDFYKSYFENCYEPVNKIFNDLFEKQTAFSRSVPNGITKYISKIKPAELEDMPSYENSMLLFKHEMIRQSAHCSKAKKRTMRELLSNPGPWCQNQTEHWKLWQIYDSKFRHIFLKPNLKFDQHVEASRNRDHIKSSNSFVNDKSDAFGTEEIDDHYSSSNYSFSTDAEIVTIKSLDPLPGTFFMSDSEICFDVAEMKNVQFSLKELEMVLFRSYKHLDNGLEFFLTSSKSYFIIFLKGNRNKVINYLHSRTLPNLKILQRTNSIDLVNTLPFTEQWVNGQLSNWEYLIKLNLLAGRSYNDFSQYPIFPWILKDYTSETIDLENPEVYRDLSLPIGALNESRLSKLIEAMSSAPDGPFKCLYRTSYSSAFYVCLYLLRLEPFTTAHIKMQSNQFDKTDRLFTSIKSCFDAVTSELPDYRELIPEFFTTPDFLVNKDNFDLGKHPTSNEQINDVDLPKWSKTADDFIRIHRMALESKYVSEHLHEWIDLIFGEAQSGEIAVQRKNTFHGYFYQSCLTEFCENESDIEAASTHAVMFGIIPRQIFNGPHPQRKTLPSIPRFTTCNHVKHAMQMPFDVTFACLYKNTMICALSSDSRVWVTPKLRGQGIFQNYGSITRYVIGTPNRNNQIEIQKKLFATVSDYFISSSTWDNAFHVFKIEQGLPHCYLQSQMHSLISSVINAGRNLLLTAWRDSSLSLWDIGSAGKEQIYRVTPHLTSIVDIDVDTTLQMFASLDKSRNLVLSYLLNGRFVRSFEIPGNDTLKKLTLISNGYIIIASSIEENHYPHGENTVSTIIRVFGLNSDLLGEFTIQDEEISQWGKAEFDNGYDGIGIVFQSGRFMFIEIPTMKIIFSTSIRGENFVSVLFISHLLSFLIIDSCGIVSCITVE
ncbi:hypothetical protein TRFO_09568 [Tritrichomonas foetus]|uniref:Beige/BEACH domain containing protein n=1 Tax=Tritrichomonas foetus TaxID=1144522 RepID=A0A1J4JJ71_9EUKA|nr:hypothetical protein TRFO_09568 [Tritrichomonas foetus]|eukprot:OHS97284.1 hypothetical protein TRFO_09568 [Tritrichomonas foetus]